MKRQFNITYKDYKLIRNKINLTMEDWRTNLQFFSPVVEMWIAATRVWQCNSTGLWPQRAWANRPDRRDAEQHIVDNQFSK